MVKPVKKFVGLANYAAIFRDPNSWKIAGNTAVYILVLLVLNFVLPYILSFILSAVIKRGQGFYKAVFFLPSVISPGGGIHSLYLDTEPHFRPCGPCVKVLWPGPSLLVQGRGVGHRCTEHNHLLEGVRL